MNFTVIRENLPLLAHGFLVTIEIASFAIVVGLVLATVTAVARLSSVAPLRWVFGTYVEVFRNTPLLVQLLLLFFGPPEFGIRFGVVETVMLSLALNNGAYMSEIIRGGLQSVPRGQLEAAASVGLGNSRTFFEIVFPQAVRVIYPAMSNQFISVVLASSLGTFIGAPELTNTVLEVNSQTYQTITLLGFLTVCYAVLSYIIARLTHIAGRRLERAY
jgi:polar amino acid transport system permease protein